MTGRLVLCTALAIALVCPLGVAASTPSATGSGSGFPSTIYPQPRYFPPWGLGSGCPSLAGVRIPQRGASTVAFLTLARFGRISLEVDLHSSDRALWPNVRRGWQRRSGRPTGNGPLPRVDVVGVHLAQRSPYAALIRRNCGGATLRRSLEFVLCERACYPATRTYVDLIDRRGQWLVWFLYP
jgi:hypothetical protein